MLSMGPIIGHAQVQESCPATASAETTITFYHQLREMQCAIDANEGQSSLDSGKGPLSSNCSTGTNDGAGTSCNTDTNNAADATCNGNNANIASNDSTGTNDSGSQTADANDTGSVASLPDLDTSGYDAYYTNIKSSEKGIIIMGSANVQSSTLDIAGSMIDQMLSKEGTGIAEKMVENQAKLAIFGKGENVFSIPEHKQFYSEGLLYAEGLGGTMSVPVTSISESNVLRLTSGDYVTAYSDENILVHEFAHAIQLIGVDQLDDKTLYQEFNAAYDHAKANNLFPNTYAISNREEFFATVTQMWFNVMNESSNGSWDGVRGPVNTHEELKAYDQQTYDFLAKIYPDNVVLSEAWANGIGNNFSAQ